MEAVPRKQSTNDLDQRMLNTAVFVGSTTRLGLYALVSSMYSILPLFSAQSSLALFFFSRLLSLLLHLSLTLLPMD